MKISRPSPSMVVAGLALFVSLGGTSVAAINYAANAGKVDGKDAVASSTTLSKAAGNLVATASSGPNKGRLPSKFLAGVPKTSTISNVFQVNDNAPGAPQTLVTMGGLGTLSAVCNDQSATPGVEDPTTIVTFANQSGEPVNVARRVGNGDGAVAVAPNQTTASLTVGGSNTFVFHIERHGQNAFINGGIRQDGRGTPAATCVVYGIVEQVLPS